MAQTVANDMVKDKEKAFKAAQNAKSKGGVTIAEKIASEQERKANIQNAEQELAIWQAIASVTEARQQAMAEAQAQAEADAEQGEAGDIKPIGKGVFGNIYDQFKGKAKEAIAFLFKRKEGEAIGALHHPKIGEISLVWGNPKAGLEKIARKHAEVLDDLQEIIHQMDVVSSSENRIKLESDTHFAVVSREYLGQPRDQWLLTAYEKKNSAFDNTMDTDETSDRGKQNDTATLQNTVSNSKDTTSSQNNNEIEDKNVQPTIGELRQAAETELKQAQAQYDEYSVLMKKELSEKEAKYAEMDSTIEAADDISNTEEDDDVLYRSSEELTDEYGDRWLTEQTNSDGRHTKQVKNTLRSYEKFGEWVERDSKGRNVSILDASSGLGLGTEHLREKGMNAETPIHEYTHLWDKMVQQKNPELWNRGKELLKQTPTWNEVINDKNYANIAHDEDAVASEVHSRLSGENGAKVLEQMNKDARKDGAMAVAKAASITERIKEWIKDMFAALKETLSAWSKQDLADLSIKDFNNLTLRDLAEGVNPTEFVTEEGDVQFSNDDEIPRLTKKRVEKIFGGIWIRDKRKFAKFASAVNTFGFEEDGEGITFTDNFFYAYYRNIDGQVIPYASVYMNRYVSQDVVNEVNKELANVKKGRRAKFYFDRAVVRFRAIQKQDNADNVNNQGASDSIQNLGVVRRLLRKGEYYYHPNLYVKTRRNDEVAERQGSGAVSDEGVTMASDPVSKAIGEPRYGRGKKMREYAERQRRLMAQKVQEIAQKLNLNNVEIVTDASTLSRAVILNTQH